MIQMISQIKLPTQTKKIWRTPLHLSKHTKSSDPGWFPLFWFTVWGKLTWNVLGSEKLDARCLQYRPTSAQRGTGCRYPLTFIFNFNVTRQKNKTSLQTCSAMRILCDEWLTAGSTAERTFKQWTTLGDRVFICSQSYCFKFLTAGTSNMVNGAQRTWI